MKDALILGGGGSPKCSLCHVFGGHTKFCDKLGAFTLAEVLVTLGVIGIVAAMTLPVLMDRYQRKVLSNQAKKTYSTVSNMIRLAEAKNGPVKEWPEFAEGIVWYKRDGEFILKSYLATQTNVNHIYTNFSDFESANFYTAFMCYTPGKTKLFRTAGGGLSEYIHMGNWQWGIARNRNIYSMSLSDGSCVGINAQDTDRALHTLAHMYIDVNGSDKGPNTLGKDLFIYVLYENGMLLPYLHEKSIEELTASRGACSLVDSDGCAALLMKLNWDMNNPLYPWYKKVREGQGVFYEERN